MARCQQIGFTSITGVSPPYVIDWNELHTKTLSPQPSTARAQISDPFDWLVIGQVVPRNPAASVCGPSHSARQRKATVLDEAAAPSKWRSYWEAVRLAAPQLSPTPAFNRNQN